MIGWVLMLACTGSAEDTGGDSGTTNSGPIYPAGDRILLYVGHSGESGNNNGSGKFDEASAWVKDTYGWNVSDRSELAEPTQYRVMVLVDSGVKGASVYGESSVALVREALDAAIRVVTVVSPENCEAGTFNQLFEDLGIAARYTGAGASSASVSVLSPSLSHQLTANVSEVRFIEACFIESNGATVLFADERDVLATVEKVGDGGEVVVMGDFSWFDDRGYLEDADHLTMLGNLVEVDPDLGPVEEGDSGG